MKDKIITEKGTIEITDKTVEIKVADIEKVVTGKTIIIDERVCSIDELEKLMEDPKVKLTEIHPGIYKSKCRIYG